ncbi:MFS transporter [Chloroflexota bacterium]
MVIMAASVLAIHALTMYTFGVFLRPITVELNWERGALSGAFSIAMLISGSLSIPAGRLSDKYGPRILVTISGLSIGIGLLLMSQINSLWQAYLIWGLFIGIGSSCCFIPVATTIPRWFTKKAGIAIGITVAGFGLGGVISPPLAQWLISEWGWQQAFIILGLITSTVVIPLAQFMKHSPQQMGLKPYGEEEATKDELPSATEGFSITQAIKTSRFWVWGLILFCFFFCIQVTTIHIVPHAIDIGISPILAASITSIIAGISIIGRLSIGFISDKVGSRLLLIACMALAALAFLWLLFAKEVWMLYVFAAIFGFAYGGSVPLNTLVSAKLFGLGSLGMILATVALCGNIGGALGAPLAGSIFDITGNYRLAFIICIIICTLAIILSLILLKARSWRGGD